MRQSVANRTAARLLLLAAVTAFPAGADGAFPDELSVYLPASQTSRIMLGTNFGLAISEDSGQSWRYVCELYLTRDSELNDLVNMYKIAAQPIGQQAQAAILAVTTSRILRSVDGGCTWAAASGSIASTAPKDAFFDPNDSAFVLAISTDLTSDAIYPSYDGGATFAGPLYRPASGSFLTSIEIARSDSSVVYAVEVSESSADQGSAYLLKSVDHGASWPSRQLLPAAKGTVPRIAAVDSADPSKLYLRILSIGASVDEIAITTDGGRTFVNTLQAPANSLFSGFLQGDDGTRYAATNAGDLFAAPAGVDAFSRRVGPHARCLGQRPGPSSSPIYACGDQFADGYNLARSDDGANTFQKVMNFTDISGPLACQPMHDFCLPQYQMLMSTLGKADAGTGAIVRPSSGHCDSIGAGPLAVLGLVALFRRRHRRRPGDRRYDRADAAPSFRARSGFGTLQHRGTSGGEGCGRAAVPGRGADAGALAGRRRKGLPRARASAPSVDGPRRVALRFDSCGGRRSRAGDLGPGAGRSLGIRGALVPSPVDLRDPHQLREDAWDA
jgi:uncharacterized protein (TIGR03382 family)